MKFQHQSKFSKHFRFLARLKAGLGNISQNLHIIKENLWCLWYMNMAWTVQLIALVATDPFVRKLSRKWNHTFWRTLGFVQEEKMLQLFMTRKKEKKKDKSSTCWLHWKRLILYLKLKNQGAKYAFQNFVIWDHLTWSKTCAKYPTFILFRHLPWKCTIALGCTE